MWQTTFSTHLIVLYLHHAATVSSGQSPHHLHVTLVACDRFQQNVINTKYHQPSLHKKFGASKHENTSTKTFMDLNQFWFIMTVKILHTWKCYRVFKMLIAIREVQRISTINLVTNARILYTLIASFSKFSNRNPTKSNSICNHKN